MKLLHVITFLFLFTSGFVFSQKTIKHTVVSGESIYSIAKKYGVTEADIYELNPKTKGAILQLKTILVIPNKNKKSKEKNSKATSNTTEIHIVTSGESLYKISKKYNISLDKLKELNPNIIPESIQIGDKIIVASTSEIPKPVQKEEKNNELDTPKEQSITDNLETDELGNKVHKVAKGETLYRLSKKYKVSVRELEEMNPEIIANLPIGYEVIVRKGNVEFENHKKEVVATTQPKEELNLENTTKAEFLISKASEHIGTRYRGGGTTSAGFDCSGLMYATFQHIDMTLPRSSSSMAVGAGYKIDRSQAQKGDLIFFSTNGRGSINHVGMITEVNGDEIKFIHSSVQAGVIISSTEEPYYKKRFIQINRVLEN